MAHGNRTLAGIAFGMGAGALWGLVFLAPAVARAFGPLQLAVGRYLAYGLLAAILLAPRRRETVARLHRGEWRALAVLAMLGNTIYYVLLAGAVQLGGIAMTSLVIGFLPVAVTIIGSRDHGAVALSRLAPSLLLGVAGAAMIGLQSLGKAPAGEPASGAAGLLCAIGALASWTCFAVGNSRALARLDHISAHDWSLLIGVAAGAQALLLAPLALLLDPGGHDAAQWTLFAATSAAIGLFASVIGNALWNRMSRLLPLTMVGQMILFETLFALFYGFLWERRLPTVFEALAMVLVVASVLSCLSAHRPRPVDAAA